MVMHERRRWGVTACTREELAQNLQAYSWTLCTAFQTPGGTIWANDSTCEDALQEYAVLRILDGAWRQVESITVSWCELPVLLQYADEADRGLWDASAFSCAAVSPQQLEAVGHGSCILCR